MRKQFVFFMLSTFLCTAAGSCQNNKNHNAMNKIIEKFYKDSVRFPGENGCGWEYRDNVPYYKIENNGKIFEIGSYTYDDIRNYKQRVIDKSDFKFLPYPQYRQRILDLYNVDMDTTYYAVLASSGPAFFSICREGFVEGYTGEEGELDATINIELNKMVVHDDVHALNWMKKNDPYQIIYQVKDVGVCTNSRWMKYVIENTDFEESHGGEPVLNEYLFGYNRYNLRTFRSQMLDTLIANGVSMALLSSVLEGVEVDKRDGRSYQYEQPVNQIINHLYAKLCDLGQTGYIEYRIDRDPTLLDYFKAQNYLGLDRLKSFCEKVYETPAKRAERGVSSSLDPDPNQYGIIVDPDGYVNLRERPTVESPVTCRINSGSKVEILRAEGNWLQVSTPKKDAQGSNVIGYIHKSRIK